MDNASTKAPRMLYSINETVQILGVQRTTVYELIGRGELETVKIGRRTLVPADSIEAFVAGLRRAG